jgi:hypothetical protein
MHHQKGRCTSLNGKRPTAHELTSLQSGESRVRPVCDLRGMKSTEFPKILPYLLVLRPNGLIGAWMSDDKHSANGDVRQIREKED